MDRRDMGSSDLLSSTSIKGGWTMGACVMLRSTRSTSTPLEVTLPRPWFLPAGVTGHEWPWPAWDAGLRENHDDEPLVLVLSSGESVTC